MHEQVSTKFSKIKVKGNPLAIGFVYLLIQEFEWVKMGFIFVLLSFEKNEKIFKNSESIKFTKKVQKCRHVE